MSLWSLVEQARSLETLGILNKLEELLGCFHKKPFSEIKLGNTDKKIPQVFLFPLRMNTEDWTAIKRKDNKR